MSSYRRATVKQPIAAIPSGILGSHTAAMRKRYVLAPRAGRALVGMSSRQGAAILFDLATGERRELAAKAMRAELAELEQLVAAEPMAPDVLRGRWAAEVGWADQAPQVRIRRRLGYVDLLVEYVHPGRWRVVPPKRRPAWFSESADWPTEPQLAGSLREALELALEQARAGIRIACERRDTTRREPPAAPKKRAPKKRRAAGAGAQVGLFAA